MKRFKEQKMYFVCMFILSVFMVLPGCGGVFGGGHWNRVLKYIEVTPPNQSIAKGTTQQYMATGIYSDDSKQDLTTSVKWTSSNTAVATVSNAAGSNGLATSVTVSPVTITATDVATGKSGSVTLTVTAATLSSIIVTPVTRSVAKGTALPFKATGTYSDLSIQDLTSSVTWTPMDASVVSFVNAAGSYGVAKALAVGSTRITATDIATGINDFTTMTVTGATLLSIGITPVNPSIAKGTPLQFTASGINSDGSPVVKTTSVSWISSNNSVATIDPATGYASTLTVGTTTIRATDAATGITDVTTLTVTDATLSSLVVTPVTRSIAKGTTLQFKATGIYSDLSTQDVTSSVTWSSLPLNNSVASISNAAGTNGLASALNVGSLTISAIDPTTKRTDSTTLTVTAATLSSVGITPVNPSIAKGTSLQFTASGINTDGSPIAKTSTVTWISSNKAVATIDPATGYATASTVGISTITATDVATGKTDSTTLTVTSATLSSLVVTPVTRTITKGTTQQFKATGIYTDKSIQDLTASVTWAPVPLNTPVASISNAAGTNGVLSALAVGGPITITATDSVTGITDSTTLTVSAVTLSSIGITPVNPSIAKGTTLQFAASGINSDGSPVVKTSSVTWFSTDKSIANIDPVTGLASALTVGTTTISATDVATGKTDSTTLKVTAATLSSILVTPVTRKIAKGTTLQFKATGIYSDLSTIDLTSSVTWSPVPLNTPVASISNAAGSYGVATALTVGGPVTITATDSATGKTDSTTLEVTAATLSSIAITPINPSIANGTTLQFTASGINSDNTPVVKTSSVTWISSAPAVASINPATGLASSLTVGTTTITATDAATGKTDFTTLKITNVTLSSIVVTPVTRKIAKGTTLQFKASGIYSDLSIQDITASVTWSPSPLNTPVASISNAAGTNGLATALAVGGPVTITAIDSATGITNSTTLEVTAATLASLSVSPINPSIAKGTTQQFTAMGINSDNTVIVKTSSVTWISSTPAVASIDPVTGLASALTLGATTITATDVATGKTDVTTLKVTAATLSSMVVTPVTRKIAKGTTLQFKATGIYSDLSTLDLTASVTWATVPPISAVASISNAAGTNGVATALTVGGPITISALDAATGITNSTTLEVTAATLSSLAITPVNPSIAKGATQQFTAMGINSDNTSVVKTLSVTWISSTPAVASIDPVTGLASALTLGATTITATDVATGKTDITTLTITAATLTSIAVTPANPGIAKGTAAQFNAMGTYSDLSTKDLTSSVTWTTTPLVSTVASISNAAGSYGVATALSVGNTTITAIDPATGTAASTTLTVTAATLSSLSVTPVNPSIAKGLLLQFVATGKNSDNTSVVKTSSVTWISSDLAVASIDPATGQATALTAGTATITATDVATGKADSTKLKVTNATLSFIEVLPPDQVNGPGETRQYVASGTFSDSTVLDISSSVVWSSSKTSVATISIAPDSIGLATTVAAGATTIKAIDPITQISAQTSLIVTIAPNLNSAKTFGVIASAKISGGAVGTTVTGNIGIATKTLTSITDFVGGGPPATPGTVIGTIYASDAPTAGNTISSTARADVGTAYQAAKTTGAAPGFVTVSGNLVTMGVGGSSTFLPGVYHSTSTLSINGAPITLDPQGDKNAVWIFDMDSTLTTTGGGNIILIAPAQAKNVYWRVGSSATLGAAIFKGTILSDTSISLTTQAIAVEGRLLASSVNDGAVTFSSHAHTVVVPAP